MLDFTKPMRVHFTHTHSDVVDYVKTLSEVFVRLGSAHGTNTEYFRFNLDGSSDFPAHRLVNVEPPKEKFVKKLAWLRHWDQVYSIIVTEHMEKYGLMKYLREYIPGKCIAITEIEFTEGDGNLSNY